MTGIRSTREQLSLIDDAYSVAGEAVYTSDPDDQLPSLDGYQLPPSFKARKRQSTSCHLYKSPSPLDSHTHLLFRLIL